MDNTVTMSFERYQELITKEVRLDVVTSVYHTSKYSSYIEDICRVFFGPKQRTDEDE